MQSLEIDGGGGRRPREGPAARGLAPRWAYFALGWAACATFALLYTLERQARPRSGGSGGGGGAPTDIYRALTGNAGHDLPKMYGNVGEKTLWAFWYHPVSCPQSGSCELPSLVQLCRETIDKHRGSFEFRLLHMDQVYDYVSAVELPFNWRNMGSPAQKKDALMNALLARYGGVAMDLTTIMFTSVDEWWEEMVAKKAMWRGYLESFGETAVWFMMARREGVFRAAVTAQIIEMGDDTWPGRCAERHHYQYLCLGHGKIGNALCMYDHDFCERDTTYGWNWAEIGLSVGGIKPLDYATILKTDPRLSVVMAKGEDLWCFIDESNMPLWTVHEERGIAVLDEFHRRLEEKRDDMRFVKLFGSGGVRAKAMSRSQLLQQPDTLLCYWLCRSGLDQCGIMSDGSCPLLNTKQGVTPKELGARI